MRIFIIDLEKLESIDESAVENKPEEVAKNISNKELLFLILLFFSFIFTLGVSISNVLDIEHPQRNYNENLQKL